MRVLVMLLVGLVGSAQAESTACHNYNPLRTAYYGDLHVHTAFSLDAIMQDTRTTPADAYRFARGEAIGIPPYGDDGRPVRMVKIGRPLDFMAVTDHSEMLGETRMCHTPEMDGYWSPYCIGLRWIPRWAGILFARTASKAERLGLCGDDGELCLEASRGPWQETITAAETVNNPDGDCGFTSFIAYEWTGAGYPEGNNLVANLHRNVVFRNSAVPELPISFIESKNAPTLYRQLDEQCADAGNGCDALVIPHNSNISLGMMFQEVTPEGKPISATDAELRARYETLVEIIQHKGASECYYGPQPPMAQDELCDFEQLPWNSFAGNTFESMLQPIQPDAGMVRQVLHRGLQQEAKLGANPFKFGVIGSTDTHRSLGGGVDEYDFPGHGGAGNAAVEADLKGLPDEWEFNPGGLAVLYAEENSRDALFDAMRRREAYATSGPRIQVRFFGAASLPEELCEQTDFVSQGYDRGVPMGGDLKGLDSAPSFAVSALKDPGVPSRPGTDLQRVQIIKGWIDSKGQSRQHIYEVAGDGNNGASVNLANCETRGSGFKELCSVWQDPDFDPEQRAFYYARIVENPTCRWSMRICNAQKVDCASPESLTDETRICCDADLKKTVQERAWTSPIWYTPES